MADILSEDFGRLAGHRLTPKVYRINRDVRFSKDKSPYNTHLHMLWAFGAEDRPGFFFAVAPAYPGDLAVALLAVDADVVVETPDGPRRIIPLANLHRLPGSTPDTETTLGPGEIIRAITLPQGDHSRSAYLKIRDRASYAFALASAAVSLTLAPEGTVTRCTIALGGLAAKPWRASEAERWLMDRCIDEGTALQVGQLALQGANATPDQGFKVALGARTVARAILTAAAGTDRC